MEKIFSISDVDTHSFPGHVEMQIFNSTYLAWRYPVAVIWRNLAWANLEMVGRATVHLK